MTNISKTLKDILQTHIKSLDAPNLIPELSEDIKQARIESYRSIVNEVQVKLSGEPSADWSFVKDEIVECEKQYIQSIEEMALTSCADKNTVEKEIEKLRASIQGAEEISAYVRDIVL